MMFNLKYSFFLFVVFTIFLVSAQPEKKFAGNSIYNKYDKTFISNNTRAKHCVTTGFTRSYNTPFSDTNQIGSGFHLGYNYIIVKRLEKYKKKKDKLKTKNYIKHGFGLHFDIFTFNESLVTFKYYRKMLSLNTGLFTFQFFNEFGLGYHKLPNLNNTKGKTALNFSFEPIRIKLLKTPLFFHATFNYDLSNNFIDTNRKNLQFIFGARYYFFKNKYND